MELVSDLLIFSMHHAFFWVLFIVLFPCICRLKFLTTLNSDEPSFSPFFQIATWEADKGFRNSVVFSSLADMQCSLLCSALVLQLYSLYVTLSSVLGPHVGSIFGTSRSHCFLLLVCEMSQEKLQQCKEYLVPSVGSFGVMLSLALPKSAKFRYTRSSVRLHGRGESHTMSDTCLRNQELQGNVRWMLMMPALHSALGSDYHNHSKKIHSHFT